MAGNPIIGVVFEIILGLFGVMTLQYERWFSHVGGTFLNGGQLCDDEAKVPV
jgi:hypothetical protein